MRVGALSVLVRPVVLEKRCFVGAAAGAKGAMPVPSSATSQVGDVMATPQPGRIAEGSPRRAGIVLNATSERPLASGRPDGWSRN
jgi:hypothetical protein